jgi:hypothetical protein
MPTIYHDVSVHLSGEATVSADATVIRLAELPRALRENRTDIILSAPKRVPLYLILAFVSLCLYLSAQDRLSTKGINHGYNVEQCAKVSYNGVELSNCVRLTKPTPTQPTTTPPTP